MTYEILTAFAAFCIASSITPGPNNLMVMTSGAHFGFTRTIPHMLGVSIGFSIMVVLVGLGLSQVFVAFPLLYDALKAISIIYLTYLTWKICRAGRPEDASGKTKPFTFTQAALFQWVNPKGWVMALSAVTLYASDHSVSSVLLVAGIFGFLNLPSIGLWAVLGTQVKRLLTDPIRLHLFNYTMAALLAVSMVPVIFG